MSEAELNPLSMSDEEAMEAEVNYDYPETSEPEQEEQITDESAAEGEADEPEVEDPTVDEQDESAPDETTDDAEDVYEEETTDEQPEEEETEADQEDSSEIDYESEYKKLLAPFKANGKEIQIESVDDAVQLMQMGANYNKKMAALKPNLKLMKMLENHSLLSEEKLSYLIDLDRKDPKAIKKLVKDSELGSYDLEESDGEEEYKPKTYTVDDSELALDAVLDDISSTPAYNETIDVVSNKWDESSRRDIVKNPEIIRVINDHVSNGIYAKISSEIERERMLGRLSGLTDIEAYRQVGDRLHAEGKFNEPAQSSQSTPSPKPKAKTPDPKVVERKRAAAPTKSTPTASSQPKDFNPLSLSDEEFEKSFSDKYI